MPSQSPHPDMTPVVRIVWSLANHHNQQKCGPWGNSQLPPATRRIAVPAGERDCSQEGSSVASTIHGQNSSPWSSLNISCVAYITEHVTSTPVATQWQSVITPTAMPGTSSRSTPAPGGTSQTDSTHRFVSTLASGIASTTTPLSGLENLPSQSLIQKSAWSLQIHCEREQQKAIRDWGCGNCKRRRCLHVDQWSPAVTASIDLVTPTRRVLYLQRADAWSFTCGTDTRLSVHATWRW